MSRAWLLVGLLLISSASAAGGWTEPLTVTGTFTEGSTDYLVVYTAEGSVYASGCSANAWIFQADSDPRRSRAYATALAALVSGKKIRLWYGDSCAAWSYHSATAVWLVN